MLAGPGGGGGEGEAHDALDADAGEDGDFGRGFPGLAPVGAAALAGVLAFGVLAHEQPVDGEGAAGFVAEVRRRAGEGADGADVGIELQRAAQG